MNATQTTGPRQALDLAGLPTAPGARPRNPPGRGPTFRHGWAAAGATLLAGALLLGAGCYHGETRRFPQAPTPLPPGADSRVTVTVNTNLRGPVRYRWTYYTNGPDGSRILKFTPGQ